MPQEAKATREDVEQLKRSWQNDACFDLWPAGPEYAEFDQELKEFQEKWEGIWEQQRLKERADLRDRHKKEMEGLNLKWPDHYTLFLYIKRLEATIQEMDERLVNIEEGRTR